MKKQLLLSILFLLIVLCIIGLAVYLINQDSFAQNKASVAASYDVFVHCGVKAHPGAFVFHNTYLSIS